MSEDFEDSLDTFTFDDISTDTIDASSFSNPVDVGDMMDDMPAEPIEIFDVEPIDNSSETEVLTAEPLDIGRSMDDAADTHTTEDVTCEELDSSRLEPSDISSNIDDYEIDAGFDIADLMDETAIESLDIEPPIDPTESIVDVDASSEPMHLSQNDVETFIENASDKEALQHLREGIQSGEIRIDADNVAEGSSFGPVLTRDVSEQWESGNNAIDNTIEVMRDDLRDKGLEDDPEMDSIVMVERARMQEELERNIRGDFSDPYQKPDFEEVLREHQASEGIATTGQGIPQELLEETPSVTGLSSEVNYDEVFEGLDDYDCDGIDYAFDTDRLDSSLDSFDSNIWEGLTLDEQKAAINDLAEYVRDVIGLDNPPEIVYYNNPVEGDYGGYSYESNTLKVNEYMLYNNEEAADTVAHELWHAYQHQRADNPQSSKDYQYQYGFDNYISSEDDFTGYQDQLVEAEARAFAQQFKDRLKMKGRRI